MVVAREAFILLVQRLYWWGKGLTGGSHRWGCRGRSELMQKHGGWANRWASRTWNGVSGKARLSARHGWGGVWREV